MGTPGTCNVVARGGAKDAGGGGRHRERVLRRRDRWSALRSPEHRAGSMVEERPRRGARDGVSSGLPGGRPRNSPLGASARVGPIGRSSESEPRGLRQQRAGHRPLPQARVCGGGSPSSRVPDRRGTGGWDPHGAVALGCPAGPAPPAVRSSSCAPRWRLDPAARSRGGSLCNRGLAACGPAAGRSQARPARGEPDHSPPNSDLCLDRLRRPEIRRRADGGQT